MVDTLPLGAKILDNKYHLLHTLGSGITSKVKLAKKLDTGVHCAVKIHTNPSQNDIESLSKEIEILQNIPHKNLINLIDFIEQSTVQKKTADGFVDTKTVYFIVVLELAEGGEMIQHLLQGGALAESHARFYFTQLMQALRHLHQSNIVHRDLKPDNILFDQAFNLKLADFGFAGSSATKADGKFSTYCGTQAYMAPEVIALNNGGSAKYDGFAADVFSAGVVLFVMARGIPPFFTASSDDRYFKIMSANRWDLYWKQHKKNTGTEISDDFMEMMQGILQAEPDNRWTSDQVMNCAWMKGQMPSSEEVSRDMQDRKNKCDAEAEAARKERAAQKLQAGKSGKQYRGLNDEDFEDEECAQKLLKLKMIAAEVLEANRQPFLYTKAHPLGIVSLLEKVNEDNEAIFEFDQTKDKDFKFNLKVTVTRKGMPELDEDDEELKEILGDIDDNTNVEVQVGMEVLKHPTEEGLFVLNFRQNGENWSDPMDFTQAMDELVNLFGDFADE